MPLQSPVSAAPQIRFLGSAAPLLPQSARWLLARMKEEGGGESFVVAVPTARAGRRLRELLAQEAGGALASPPTIVVVASVLEAVDAELRLLEAPGAEERQAALVLAFADLSTASRAHLSRQLAEGAGIGAQWAVAGRLLETLRLLWGGGARAAQLAGESPRHAALAELEACYARRLPGDGDWRRLARVEEGLSPAPGLRLVLVGCLDMLGVVAAGLRQLAQAGLPVDALVPAEASEAEGFDDLGCVRSSAWVPRALELGRGELVCVEGIGDHHAAVLRLLEGASPLAPEEATLVLCDEREAPALVAQLGEGGWRVRQAAGEPLAARDPGAVALALLGLWRESSHAALRGLAAAWPRDGDAAQREAQLLKEARDGVLDDLAVMPASAAVSHGWLAALEFLPASGERAPLGAWCQKLAGKVAVAFPGLHAPTGPTGQALAEMGARWRLLSRLALPPMSAAEAAAILSADLAAVRVPALGAGAGEGEAVGFLEALLDEAPVLAVVGAVEGCLPGWRAGDPFLPGHVRARLGLPTEESLRARDKALLTLALRPRRARAVIAARRDAEGNPLQPAQLLFEGLDDATLAARCLLFFGDDRDQAASGLPRPAPLCVPDAACADGQDAFLPIRAARQPERAWRDRLAGEGRGEGVSVSALKTMLACPARFALRHVERLRATDPPPAELESNAFGDLVHRVLCRFHRRSMEQPAWRPAPDVLAKGLASALADEARRSLGPTPGLAVSLQLERARERLDVFALRQADLWAQGWQVIAAEHELAWLVEDELESPVRLHGRVDRVDRHPTLGLRIMDFKTGDQGKKPRETHLGKEGWRDLQLPLYVLLAWRDGLPLPGERVEAGYFLLDPAVSGWAPADFSEDEISAAQEKTTALLAQILRQEFPVGEAPDFADGFAALLCDGAADRDARIERSGGERGGA